MFFYELIKSIQPSDKVLEVGPGGNPHPRSDVLLEKVFDDHEAAEQRGHASSLDTAKEIHFYEGATFPFRDGEFDYVICTHVLEHVPAHEIEFFLKELQRVAAKGYIEYPTIYYEYLYNFGVHKTILHRKDGVISYADKDSLGLNSFLPLQRFFHATLAAGMHQLVENNKEVFFQGYEWFGKELIAINRVELDDYVSDQNPLPMWQSPRPPSFARRVLRRFFS